MKVYFNKQDSHCENKGELIKQGDLIYVDHDTKHLCQQCALSRLNKTRPEA